jgi:hypothetical protein
VPNITNTSTAPKVFNLRNGIKWTLAPGQSADLDLATPIKEDRVLSGWLKAGEIAEGIVAPPPPPSVDAITAAEVEAAAALAKARAMREGGPANG